MHSNDDTTARIVVCLHFLGGSAREWRAFATRLAGAVQPGPATRCVALDLPGFGDAARQSGTGVTGMADAIAAKLGSVLDGSPWWIVGHSMGAKIALVLAHRAEAGNPQLAGLAGLVLVAGSPASPEPMSNDRRAEMIAWIESDPSTRRRKATEFVAQNVGSPLTPSAEADAVEDVLRTNPIAWKMWLADGSREDWCRAIGVLRTPALIVSGTADADLGPDAQAALMAPHFARYEHVALDGGGHLLPLERPDALADHVVAFMEGPPPVAMVPPDIGEAYRALIASRRVNTRLRDALNARAEVDDPAYQPEVLDPVELSILRAVCGRVLPQPGASIIDIAARIDRRLSTGAGDGWRFDELPRDGQAYGLALRSLDRLARRTWGRPFVTLDAPSQDDCLQAIDRGRGDGDNEGLDPSALRLWFEDLRADVVRVYLAHPVALARLGFSGIGAGGDDVAYLSGFERIGIGERDLWEPNQGTPV